jgi:hypothetical protein
LSGQKKKCHITQLDLRMEKNKKTVVDSFWFSILKELFQKASSNSVSDIAGNQNMAAKNDFSFFGGLFFCFLS